VAYDPISMSPGDPRVADPGKEERRELGVPIVPAFDGYRAFAILGVVMIHVLLSSGVSARAGGSALGQLIWGTFGQAVDILFIVSGFVVFLPTVARRSFGPVEAYAVRRIARIVPAYWLALALLLIVMVAFTPPGLPYPSASTVGIHATFLQTPAYLVQSFTGGVDGLGFGVDNPVWTLSVEMAFYLVLPLIAMRYLRRPLIGLAVCAAVAIGWRELFQHFDSVAGLFGGHPEPIKLIDYRFASVDQFPFWIFSFGLGMTGAWAFVGLRDTVDPHRLARLAGFVQLASIAAVALFIYLAGHYARTVTPPFTAAVARESITIGIGYSAAIATFMVATTMCSARRQWPFSASLPRRLGDISYGIYLSHFAIGVYVAQLLSPVANGSLGAFILWAAIVFPCAAAYGYLSARYVEVPIRRWARRYGRRDMAPTGAAAQTR
jgi:peptidoglycan/LPS O-acetylase OafA/YrhL